MNETAPQPIRTDTTVAIVGGGPAGVVLSLLLAKTGVDVTLLESHGDFDRQFRGDSVHPSTLELMDQLGLADRLLEQSHTKTTGIPTRTSKGLGNILDLSVLKSKFPYFLTMPQPKFLEFIVGEAQKSPHFNLVLRANVRKLIEENGIVKGVAYQKDDGWHEVHAGLVVATDGRHSMVRKLAKLEPITAFVPPNDTVWFKLPLGPNDPEIRNEARIGERGLIFILLRHENEWQIARNIPKGSFAQFKAAGLEAFKRDLLAGLPEFGRQIEAIDDFKIFNVLDVQGNRLEKWHKPGVLFIGDAAHTMSPALGVGINLAIQDAVASANILTEGLLEYQRSGASLPESELAKVQRKREGITKIIQRVQDATSKGTKAALEGKPMSSPVTAGLLNFYPIKLLMARLIGLCWTPERWQYVGVNNSASAVTGGRRSA